METGRLWETTLSLSFLICKIGHLPHKTIVRKKTWFCLQPLVLLPSTSLYIISLSRFSKINWLYFMLYAAWCIFWAVVVTALQSQLCLRLLSSFVFAVSTLLRDNLHKINPTNLKCKILWVIMVVYTLKP